MRIHSYTNLTVAKIEVVYNNHSIKIVNVFLLSLKLKTSTMATGIKGICYNETSQLNSVDFKPSHIRKFCDGTQHFTRLSSKIFDNVIYESIYGVSIPGMTDDIMGGSSKRYSSILTDSGNDIKRRSIDRNHSVDCKSNDLKMVEARTEKKAEEIMINEPPDTDILLKNLKNLESCERKEVLTAEKQTTPIIRTRKNESIDQHVVTNPTEEKIGKQDMEQPEVISLEKDSPDNDTKRGDSDTAEKTSRFRSNSECIGRTPRNSNQVDITSNPLYKEIYANNLRQYGFLLAKKLGISNQSPRELRATYLQNRQRAELRRERSNSSFADFSKRLNKPAAPSTDGRRVSMTDVPVVRRNTESTELPPKTRMQRSNTIGSIGNTIKEFPVRTRMQRSNTVEYLDRAKDSLITSLHSRSVSDLTNKYSDSLTNISEIAREKDSNKHQVPLRRMKKSSNVELRRHSYSPPLNSSSCSTNSTDDINKDKDLSIDVDAEPCHQRVHSGTFSDKEPSKKQPTTVIRRKHKNIRDPHKRLSVPLFNTNNGSNSPPRHTRRLSLPLYTNTEALTSMASLSVPDLYHNSSFGKEQLMDTYCKQDVPRKKLSVESLRRHNEAKERLEWRMSKLKTFESLLSEADSFMKEVRTMNASISTVSTTITEETIIPE